MILSYLKMVFWDKSLLEHVAERSVFIVFLRVYWDVRHDWLHSTKTEFFFINTSNIIHTYNTSSIKHQMNAALQSIFAGQAIYFKDIVIAPFITSLWWLSQSQLTSSSRKQVPLTVTGHYRSKKSLLTKYTFFPLLLSLPLWFHKWNLQTNHFSTQTMNNIKLQ